MRSVNGKVILDWKIDMSYQAAKKATPQRSPTLKRPVCGSRTGHYLDQKNDITLAGGANVVNMCADNYLSLANNTG